MSPPLKRWGHVALPVSAQSVSPCLWVSHLFRSSFLSCRRSNTQCWPNAGLMLAHRLWRSPNINPVLGYRGSCLVSHWMWATVIDGGSTLTQLWFKALCLYSLCYTSPPLTRQYVGVTYISPMSGHFVRRWPTFKRHWGGVYFVYALLPAWSTD